MCSSPSDFHITQLTLVNMSVCACACVFKDRKSTCRERSQSKGRRQESVCKGACILSLCGLCCSDKFRVCPDFLESLIPKIPPGDSEHPVHTKSTVTQDCDHDHMHMDTHTQTKTSRTDDLTFTTWANHFLSTRTQTQPL